MGAVDILIVWENLEISRLVLKNHQTDGKWMFKNIIFSCISQQESETFPYFMYIVHFPFHLISQCPNSLTITYSSQS